MPLAAEQGKTRHGEQQQAATRPGTACAGWAAGLGRVRSAGLGPVRAAGAQTGAHTAAAGWRSSFWGREGRGRTLRIRRCAGWPRAGGRGEPGGGTAGRSPEGNRGHLEPGPPPPPPPSQDQRAAGGPIHRSELAAAAGGVTGGRVIPDRLLFTHRASGIARDLPRTTNIEVIC